MKRPFLTGIRLLGVISLIALGGILQSTAGRAYCHSEFQKYFEGLGAAEARVNPVERLVFSVLLTATRPQPQATRVPQAPAKQL